MRRATMIALAIVVTLVVAGCAPTVTVVNNTKFPVRANVVSDNGPESVAPSPGESSSVEVAEGHYNVTVIPDKDWISYAQLTRKVLSDSLANPNLTPDQILDINNRLKDISDRVNQLAAAAGKGASCGSSIGEGGGTGIATVTTGTDGSLLVSCS